MRELLEAERALKRATNGYQTSLNELSMMNHERLLTFRSQFLYRVAGSPPRSHKDIIIVLSYMSNFITD